MNSYDNRAFDMQNLHGYSDQDINRFIESLNIQKNEIVLDIGCGGGKLGLKCKQYNPKKIIMMDYSDFQLERAKLSSNILLTFC